MTDEDFALTIDEEMAKRLAQEGKLEIEDLPMVIDEYKQGILIVMGLIATFLFFIAFILWFCETPPGR